MTFVNVFLHHEVHNTQTVWCYLTEANVLKLYGLSLEGVLAGTLLPMHNQQGLLPETSHTTHVH